MPASRAPERCLVLWFPDWPVTAWEHTEPGIAADVPVAVVAANRVIACSASARADGVRPGLRRREAQALCQELRVVPADPGRDQRRFAPVLDLIDALAPGVQAIRPGLCALRMRGPARYYGGELEAATVLLDAAAEIAPGGRAGIADGVFTAEQAAYLAEQIEVVAPGGAREFLAQLPIDQLDDEELAGLLPRLGVRTLGDFAALDPAPVRNRFGDRGARLHQLAGGLDSRRVQPRSPKPELARLVEFEPPLTLVEQVAFGVRQTVEEFIAALTTSGLVCTELRVELLAERGEQSERVWLHPAAFDAPAVVDRVRWQLESVANTEIESGIVRVRLEPVAVDALGNHDPGLFGFGADERVHHALSRVQAMLGHTGVLTPVIGGGRWLADRQLLVPWGDRPVVLQPRDRPWQGSLPEPLPATVFTDPRPLQVLGADGDPITVDGRGNLSAPPSLLVEGRSRRPVVGWAGPWPVTERGWDPDRQRRSCRFQVIDVDQTAWLLVLTDGTWRAEGRYD